MHDRAHAPWLYLASQSPRRRELLAQWGWRVELLLPEADEDLHALAACRTWGVESENRPQRAQFAPGSPPHSPAMGPEDGAKWAAADDLQPTIPNSDRLLETLEQARPNEAPVRYVQRVTQLKLLAALQRLERRGWPPGPVLCADTTVALGRQIYGKPADAAHAVQMLHSLAGQRHQVLTAVALAHQGQIWQALSRSTVEFAPWGLAEIEHYVASGEPMGKAGAYAIQGRASQWIRRIIGSHSGIVGLPAYETAQLLRAAGLAQP